MNEDEEYEDLERRLNYKPKEQAMNKQQEALKLALDVLTDRGQRHPDDYKELKNDAITAIREALAEQPAQQQEHITDGTPCWCNPVLDYKDPDTGAEVWIHKEPQ